MTEVYNRLIRIEAKKGAKGGHSVLITDADTGEHIPHITAATVYIKPNDVVTAELVYLETDGTGNLILKDDSVVEHTVVSENPEIDLNALERGYVSIGGYDIMYESSATPGKSYAVLTIGDETRTAVQLHPDEALELLNWLQQERSNLEQLAMTCNAQLPSRVNEVLP